MAKHRSAVPTQRQLRVGEELRHALSEVLARGNVRDPEIKDMSITVTEVRVSPDLRNATAFVTPLGGGHMADAVKGLRRAAPFFRAQMARMVDLKFVPNLTFEADTSFDQATRIDRLLRGVAPAGDDDDNGRDRGT